MSPLFWLRLLLYGAICAALVGLGAVGAGKYYAPRLEAEKRAFAEFRGGVEALGRAAIERRQKQERADQLLKEKADRENKDATGKLLADNRRLRDERDKSRGGGVLPPAPTTGRTDLACFDRVEFERATGELLGSLRGLTSEGDQSALSLRTAREWAAR